MKIKILLTIFLLSGCAGTITKKQLEYMEEICSSRQGIDFITKAPGFAAEVKCNNGEYFGITKDVMSLLDEKDD